MRNLKRASLTLFAQVFILANFSPAAAFAQELQDLDSKTQIAIDGTPSKIADVVTDAARTPRRTTKRVIKRAERKRRVTATPIAQSKPKASASTNRVAAPARPQVQNRQQTSARQQSQAKRPPTTPAKAVAVNRASEQRPVEAPRQAPKEIRMPYMPTAPAPVAIETKDLTPKPLSQEAKAALTPKPLAEKQLQTPKTVEPKAADTNAASPTNTAAKPGTDKATAPKTTVATKAKPDAKKPVAAKTPAADKAQQSNQQQPQPATQQQAPAAPAKTETPAAPQAQAPAAAIGPSIVHTMATAMTPRTQTSQQVQKNRAVVEGRGTDAASRARRQVIEQRRAQVKAQREKDKAELVALRKALGDSRAKFAEQMKQRTGIPPVQPPLDSTYEKWLETYQEPKIEQAPATVDWFTEMPEVTTATIAQTSYAQVEPIAANVEMLSYEMYESVQTLPGSAETKQAIHASLTALVTATQVFGTAVSKGTDYIDSLNELLALASKVHELKKIVESQNSLPRSFMDQSKALETTTNELLSIYRAMY